MPSCFAGGDALDNARKDISVHLFLSDMPVLSPNPDVSPAWLAAIAEDLRIAPDVGIVHKTLGTLPLFGDGYASDDSSAQRAATSKLTRLIYAHYYLQDPVRTEAALRRTSPVHNVWMLEDPEWGSKLRAANRGRYFWSSGWTVESVSARHDAGTEALGTEDERAPRWFEISNGHVCLHATTDELMPNPEAAAHALSPGASVRVRMPCERPYYSPGFYMAIGEAGAAHSIPSVTVRVYFHVRVDTALLLTRQITEHLNRQQIPFTYKVINSPERFTRPDSAVLYIPASTYGAVRDTLRVILTGSSEDDLEVSLLTPRIPLFTKELAPGVGCAEEPNSETRTSFGYHRSTLLARALVRAAAETANTASDRRNAIRHEFQREELSLEMPYLNPGSSDIYTPLFGG